MTNNDAAPSTEASAAPMLLSTKTAATQLPSRNRKVIHATCALHRGPVGFANVDVSKRGG